jgi:hypothetical protein
LKIKYFVLSFCILPAERTVMRNNEGVLHLKVPAKGSFASLHYKYLSFRLEQLPVPGTDASDEVGQKDPMQLQENGFCHEPDTV